MELCKLIKSQFSSNCSEEVVLQAGWFHLKQPQPVTISKWHENLVASFSSCLQVLCRNSPKYSKYFKVTYVWMQLLYAFTECRFAPLDFPKLRLCVWRHVKVDFSIHMTKPCSVMERWLKWQLLMPIQEWCVLNPSWHRVFLRVLWILKIRKTIWWNKNKFITGPAHVHCVSRTSTYVSENKSNQPILIISAIQSI